MGTPSTLHDLKTLILSFHPLLVMETVEEDRVRELLASAAHELNLPLFEWTVTRGLGRSPGADFIFGTQTPLGLLQHLEGMSVEAIFMLKDFGPHLGTPDVARALREVKQLFMKTRSTLVMTGESIELPSEVRKVAVYFDWQPPDEGEVHAAVRALVRSLQEKNRIQISLSAADMDKLVGAVSGMTLNQARQIIAYAALADGQLGPDDIPGILDRKAQLIRESGLLEYYPAEDNPFELGGFGRLKQWLERARTGFSDEARAMNLAPPKGLMLVGVQGCGKSLAAKVIAREWGLPLLKLDAGTLYEKYIGESEKNFRRAVGLAESMAPCVLWIDEIEKAINISRSGEGDGGLSQRLFGAFLTWLQEKKEDVFVVATANDIMSLPPEFQRKGRFDEVFFVDLPNDAERKEIFRIHLELRRQNPKAFDCAALVQATAGFSGAEIEQAVIGCLYRALHEDRPPDTALLLQEIAETVPLSVSRREDLEGLREFARGRFVPVS